MSTTEQTADQFLELLQGFLRLQPKLIKPEQAVQFKKQMERLRKSGMANPEDRPLFFRIFAILAHSTLPPTMGELSSELGIPLSSATRIIDLLVDSDFVERVNDPSDRRVVRIQMSENGKRFSKIAMEFIKQRIASLLENFSSSEQKQLLQLMTKLLTSLQAEAK
ncbi:MAG: MarR family transcriptional regulator [Chloroflexi bacterium]|nr:MarR family transcriptional regulator [Chloroflexota bacterium]